MRAAEAQTASDARRAWEERLAAPMFALAALFLTLLAAAIQLSRAADQTAWGWTPFQVVLGGLLLLWPIFLVEGIARYFLGPRSRRTWKGLAVCVGVGLAPPLRMAAHSRTRPDHLWLPGLGWRKVDFDLNKTLERAFGGPMFFMALLILPVLAVEYFWSEAIESYPLLQAALKVAVSVIWLAFAVEFLIRISAAEKKLGYAVSHWVDLAIVLLPMLEFLPFLRLLRVTRIMRLQNIARMAKYYRIYGLAEKGWRGAVVLQVIQQWFSRSPEARLARLRSQLEDTNEQIRDLEREADYYCRRIEEAEAELYQNEEANDARHTDARRDARRPVGGERTGRRSK